MVYLIDLDSILYTSVYRVVGIRAMREAISKFGKEAAKQWLMEEVYNEAINRCENELLKIQKYVDSQMIQEYGHTELFITTCRNSFRKKIAPEYKAKRKRNKYVWMLRDHYQINGARFSDTHEADDLIANRARELGPDNCVVISIDKDLKQIGGYYWSYYKMKSRDSQGNLIINDFGFAETEYKQKAIDYITKEQSEKLFWGQMLMGDHSDNIKGLHRVGKKTAEKILKDAKVNWFKVAREYISRNQKEAFKINYQLLKLG